jgi:hypothetical protein
MQDRRIVVRPDCHVDHPQAHHDTWSTTSRRCPGRGPAGEWLASIWFRPMAWFRPMDGPRCGALLASTGPNGDASASCAAAQGADGRGPAGAGIVHGHRPDGWQLPPTKRRASTPASSRVSHLQAS